MVKTTKPNRRQRMKSLAILLLTMLPLLLASRSTAEEIKTITISAAGDCTLGRNHKMAYEDSWDDCYAKYGAEYFLQDVSSVFLQDDLTIVNLEGVLSESAPRQEVFYRQRTGKYSEKKYCHLGKPEYLAALTLGGVDAVSFANNHNIDYGLQGFEDTLDACADHRLPVAYYDTVARFTVSGMTVGVASVDATYCSTEVAEAYLRAAMNDLRADCDLIVACMHWGKNYEQLPDDRQRALGRLCVDLGADLVIGHHAHILQGVERYRGRYIFYSLGNFTYGGRAVPRDVDTMIAQQTFTFVDGVLQVDDNVTLLPCWMSTRREINDFRPVIQQGAAASAIIDKVNALSATLGTRFDATGHPAMVPEANAERPLPDISAPVQTPPRVPAIIRTLLGE